MKTNPAPVCAATSAIFQSVSSPFVSFTISAPASTARNATSGFRVSIEMGTVSFSFKASTTGRTRRSSSLSATGLAPGRVDSPPISMMPAPSPSISRACSIAAPGSSHSPPSEKESGVTLRTPMTTTRSRDNARCGNRTCICLPAVDEAHRLRARRLAASELSSHRRRHRLASGLSDPAHAHTEVLGLDDDEDAPGVEGLFDRVRNLGGEPFLHLGPSREGVDDPGQLRQPRDLALLVGDVSHLGLADERNELVPAQGEQRDVAHHDHLVVAYVEDGVDLVDGIEVEALEQLGVHVCQPPRRLLETLALGILPDSFEDLG